MSSTSEAADSRGESTVDFVARLGEMVHDGRSDPLSALIALRARIDQAKAEAHRQKSDPGTFAELWRAQTELPFLLSVDRLLVCRLNNDDLAYEEEALRANAIAEWLNRAVDALRRLDRKAVIAGLDQAWKILNEAPGSRPSP